MTIGAQDDLIAEQANNANEITRKDMDQVLSLQNIDVSQSSVRRRLEKIGYRYMMPLSKLPLTPKHHEQCFR